MIKSATLKNSLLIGIFIILIQFLFLSPSFGEAEKPYNSNTTSTFEIIRLDDSQVQIKITSSQKAEDKTVQIYIRVDSQLASVPEDVLPDGFYEPIVVNNQSYTLILPLKKSDNSVYHIELRTLDSSGTAISSDKWFFFQSDDSLLSGILKDIPNPTEAQDTGPEVVTRSEFQNIIIFALSAIIIYLIKKERRKILLNRIKESLLKVDETRRNLAYYAGAFLQNSKLIFWGLFKR